MGYVWLGNGSLKGDAAFVIGGHDYRIIKIDMDGLLPLPFLKYRILKYRKNRKFLSILTD